MNSRYLHFVTFLVLAGAWGTLIAKEEGSGTGLIPATPPINIHTSPSQSSYRGFGYLKFDVTLPLFDKPEFTLGKAEDERFQIGNVDYTTHNIVYVSDGVIDHEESTEKAWLIGSLKGVVDQPGFTRFNVHFDLSYQHSGFVVGRRTSFAKRLFGYEWFVFDYSFSSLFAFYRLEGDTRIESDAIPSETYRYISDFHETSNGIAYRPMLTLQPTFKFGSWLTIIPFGGITAFANLSFSEWEVKQWQDVLYGNGCRDGCGDDGFFPGFVPLEGFIGFDVEFHFYSAHTLSLSSFFAAGVQNKTANMSEVYVVYTWRVD